MKASGDISALSLSVKSWDTLRPRELAACSTGWAANGRCANLHCHALMCAAKWAYAMKIMTWYECSVDGAVQVEKPGERCREVKPLWIVKFLLIAYRSPTLFFFWLDSAYYNLLQINLLHYIKCAYSMSGKKKKKKNSLITINQKPAMWLKKNQLQEYVNVESMAVKKNPIWKIAIWEMATNGYAAKQHEKRKTERDTPHYTGLTDILNGMMVEFYILLWICYYYISLGFSVMSTVLFCLQCFNVSMFLCWRRTNSPEGNKGWALEQWNWWHNLGIRVKNISYCMRLYLNQNEYNSSLDNPGKCVL